MTDANTDRLFGILERIKSCLANVAGDVDREVFSMAVLCLGEVYYNSQIIVDGIKQVARGGQDEDGLHSQLIDINFNLYDVLLADWLFDMKVPVRIVADYLLIDESMEEGEVDEDLERLQQEADSIKAVIEKAAPGVSGEDLDLTACGLVRVRYYLEAIHVIIDSIMMEEKNDAAGLRNRLEQLLDVTYEELIEWVTTVRL